MGNSVGAKLFVSTRRARNCSPKRARSKPTVAPSAATANVSLNSCATSLAEEAPSAARTASSCRRRPAFANVKFATLAQAINSTSAAAPSDNSSI
jgi:hypothetical protein